MNAKPSNTIIIAIAGGSASGKSTVAKELLDALGPDRTAILPMDAYYRNVVHSGPEDLMKFNFDHPDAFDLALFKEQLADLREGKTIEKPIYDFMKHRRIDEVEVIEPKNIVIVEGLYVLLDELCQYFDLKVFINTPDDLRIIRRILRDVKERGRQADGVIQQYLDTVRPMHLELVAPTQKNADICVSWEEGHPRMLATILTGIRRLMGIMKILVIGSEGFIGGFLTKALMGEGHEVVGFDIGEADELRAGYELVKGDLLDYEKLKNACADVEMVINLAAKHHDFGISREDFFKINEEGTRHILAVLSEMGVKRFVFMSSVAVYGDVDGCATEGSPLNPSNDYGESKLAGESVIQKWIEADATREVLVVRPTVIFGPHNYANMYRLIDNIHKRRFVPVGKGENIKTVTYVENLVDATLFLIERLGPGLSIYNYSDYPHHTSNQLVNMITDFLGRKRQKVRLPLAPVVFFASAIDALAKVTHINFPITAKRIKKMNMTTWYGSDRIRELGFVQKIPIKEGLRRMVSWYVEQKGKK